MTKGTSRSELCKILGIAEKTQAKNFDTAELECLAFIKQNIIPKKANNIAQQLGLQLAPATSRFQPLFKESWEQFTNELKMATTLTGKATGIKTTFAPDNRTIEIHLQNTQSNNDFNSNDINDMFDSIFQAAVDLAPTHNQNKDAYLIAINDIKKDFVTGKEYVINGKKTTFSLTAIKKSLSNPKIKLEDSVKKCAELNKLFVGELAIALWRANGHTGEPKNSDYAKYVKNIQQKEIANVSKKKRPISVHIYKQEVAQPEANTDYYLMVTHTPKSDQSSASRTMTDEEKMFSNHFEVTIERIKIKHQPKNVIKCEVEKLKQYERSSSIARLVPKLINKKQKNEDLDIVYNSFCQMLRLHKRDQLIKQINNGETPDLSNRADKLAIITLFSPFVSKEKGQKLTSKLGKTVTTKTIFENEADQLKTVEYCMERVAKENNLKLTEDDIAYILKHTEKKQSKISLEKLKAITIKPSGYYSNFMVNKVGPVLSENLDLAQNNWQYFLRGNKHRRNMIAEHFSALSPISIDQKTKQSLLAIINNKDKKTISVELIKFLNKHENEIKDPNSLKILKLYIYIEKYFLDAKRGARFKKFVRKVYAKLHKKLTGNDISLEHLDRATLSYIAANMDAELAKCLGIEKIHFTCKSGVDRTGLLASFAEALCANPDVFNINKQLLQKNLLNSLNHGANRKVKRLNLPGMAGLQLPNNVLTSMRHIADFLRNKCSSFIGSMSRIFYSQAQNNETFQNILKHENKASKQLNAHKPVVANKVTVLSSSQWLTKSFNRLNPAAKDAPEPSKKTNSTMQAYALQQELTTKFKQPHENLSSTQNTSHKKNKDNY